MDPQEVLKHSKITGNSICGISGSGININATDLIVTGRKYASNGELVAQPSASTGGYTKTLDADGNEYIYKNDMNSRGKSAVAATAATAATVDTTWSREENESSHKTKDKIEMYTLVGSVDGKLVHFDYDKSVLYIGLKIIPSGYDDNGNFFGQNNFSSDVAINFPSSIENIENKIEDFIKSRGGNYIPVNKRE